MKTIKKGASPAKSRALEERPDGLKELRLRRIKVRGNNCPMKIIPCFKRSALKVEQIYFAECSLSPAYYGTIISQCIWDTFETEFI